MELPENTFALVISAIVVLLITHYYSTQPRTNVKEGQLSLPPKFSYVYKLLRGKLDLKNSGPNKLVELGYKKCGEIFRIRFLTRHITFLIGGKASAVIFDANDSMVSMKNVYGFMIPVFGNGIVYDASPLVMAQQTKWILFGLTSSYLESYCQKIANEAFEYFSKFPNECVRDVHDVMLELVAYTASRCLVGDEVRDKLTSNFGHLLFDLSNGVSHLSVFFPNAPSERHRKRNVAHKAIVDFIVDIIKNRREKGIQRNDYLQHLMNQKYRDGSLPTDENIGCLVLATLFGGQHTSSNSLTFLVMQIAYLKDQFFERLKREQTEAFVGDSSLSTKKLAGMNLLNNCIKEVLRLYPPLIILAREATETLMFGNYYIPKGDIVAVSPPMTHHIPGVFTEPDRFDPDRFSPERNEGSGKFDYQPFGGGRHKCIGRHFAFIQIKTIFSVMIQMFDFELEDSNWVPKVDYSGIIAGPWGENKMLFKKRSKESLLVDCS